MPRRHTLGALVTLAKQRCDLENDANISDPEWKGLLALAYAPLAATVSETGCAYFETTFSIVSTGALSYDEPDDHFMTVGLDRILDAAGRRRALKRVMAQDRAAYAGLTGEAYAYAHVDDQYFLLPKPPTGHTFELQYVYQPPDFSAEDDDYVVDVVTPDGEAMLIWGVAVMALHKHQKDERRAVEECTKARANVYEWATLKHLHEGGQQVMPPLSDDGGSYPGDWEPY